MNSSTSNSKSRCSNLFSKKEMAISLIFFLGLSGLLTGLNIYVDPFDFYLSSIRLDVDRRKLFRLKNTALWASGEVQKIPKKTLSSTSIVIIGDSRGRQLTGANDRTLPIHKSSKFITNYSFGGAHQGEMIRFFEGLNFKLNSLETAIVLVSFDRLSQSSDYSRIDDATLAARFPLSYLFNFRTISYYWDELITSSLGEVVQSKAIATENQKDNNETSIEDKKVIDIVNRRIESTNEKQAMYILDQEVFPSIDLLINQGTKVVFYMPPVHPQIEESISQSQQSLYQLVIERLLEKGDVYDLSMYDGASSVFEFADPMHTTGAAHSILEDILNCANSEEKSLCVSQFKNNQYSPFLSKGSKNTHAHQILDQSQP
ncbi:MAG: hypothetical protein WBA57_10440 [Elainellaceae cyanobacterium]